MFGSVMDYLSYSSIPVIAIQVACAVHVIKTGRSWLWLWLIFFIPFVGCLVYVIVEVVPTLRHGGSRVAARLAKTIDPQRDRRQREGDLALSNTVENKRMLAEECLRAEDYARAAELYESCLTGVHKTDPTIMLGLAEAQFHLGRYDRTREVLDRLIETNPNFKSPEGHLLYARTLEALGDADAAFEEYRVLAGYYPGVEAKCRYALLLRQIGKTTEARELFNEIVLSAKKFRRFYKDDKRWIATAREQLAKAGG